MITLFKAAKCLKADGMAGSISSAYVTLSRACQNGVLPYIRKGNTYVYKNREMGGRIYVDYEAVKAFWIIPRPCHRFTPDEARAAGRKGGTSLAQDRDHMVEIARRGGAKVSQDVEHMREIGRKGGQS